MAGNYVFSLQPTFTQGLIFGQLSILVLLILILKYLFLDSSQYPFESSTYHPRVDGNNISLRNRSTASHAKEEDVAPGGTTESSEWLNMLLRQIVDVYRGKLRDDLPGPEGDEIARKRVEDFANKMRPASFLDYIQIHSVDLGVSAPRIDQVSVRRQKTTEPLSESELHITYTDTVSISLSTSYLFNYPMPSFARLPVTLTVSLSLFKSSIVLTTPPIAAPTPVITFTVSPEFTLDLTTTSLMGSRAKLANVPKLHELIQHQVRKVLASKASWQVVLPGLATVSQVQQQIKKESLEEDTW